jgi:hypothetical protein
VKKKYFLLLSAPNLATKASLTSSPVCLVRSKRPWLIFLLKALLSFQVKLARLEALSKAGSEIGGYLSRIKGTIPTLKKR